MPDRILIVDDEPSIRQVLKAQLQRVGLRVDAAHDGSQAIALLQEIPFAAVVTDLQMPNTSGLELLAWIREHQPRLPVILITAFGTVDSAVEAIKQGAFDYITKPFDLDELLAVVGKALETARRDSRHLRSDRHSRFDLIGRTPVMREIYQLIDKVAPSPTTVLIIGESGTGKELVARALHQNSTRADGPFIQINCGAIPEALFESEIFGYERGSFTGAVNSKPGKFELAQGGTLFLDEVGELPRDMQVKILRALQERRIDRVGGLRPIDLDVRVIAATNRDLIKAVNTGTFREDLYYRLNVIPIQLPALRDRRDDIPLLVDHFLQKFNERLHRSVREVSPDTLAALLAHPWPGNIRELENLMERAVLLSETDTIHLRDIPGLRGAPASPQEPEDLEEIGLKEYVRLHTAKIERERIVRILRLEEGNVTRAARRLGISRKSLQTKMKDYGLRDEHSP